MAKHPLAEYIQNVEKTHKFELRSLHLAMTAPPPDVQFIGHDSATLNTPLTLDRAVWHKIEYLAALNNQSPYQWIDDALTTMVEEELSNFQELGELIAKRITEEAEGTKK